MSLLQHRLLQIVEVHRVLRRSSSNDVVLVVVITSGSRKFLRIRELDVDAILFHDALDAATSNSNNSLVISFRNVEGYLGGQLFLEKRQALQDRSVIAGDVDQKVVVVESFELDLDVGHLHDFVDLPVLLATDELAVLVG